MRSVRRSEFLALAAAGAAGAGVALSNSSREARGADASADGRALNLLLKVEYAEAAFYARALREAGLKGELRRYAEQVAEHEREHLAFVKDALGTDAEPEPEFDFGAATRSADAFAERAAALEDLAVAAYNGQGANVSPKTLDAAATVVSVEARHAAWIRSIVGSPPAPDPVDTPKSENAVVAELERLGMKA